MNRLAFNPNKEIIQQWKDIYLSKEQIVKFESLIDKLYIYLDIILTHKVTFLQKQRKITEMLTGSKNIILSGINIIGNVIDAKKQQDFYKQSLMKEASQQLKNVGQLKQKFMEQYDRVFGQDNQPKNKDTQKQDFVHILATKYQNPKNYTDKKYQKINFTEFFQFFQEFFSDLEDDILRTYMKYLTQNDSLIQNFVYFKIHALRTKLTEFVDIKNSVLKHERKYEIHELPEQSFLQINTLFQNIFIEVHYLAKLVHYNLQIFKQFEEETDDEIALLSTIRQRHKKRMNVLRENVEKLKIQLRSIYIFLYDTPRAIRKDPIRLWKLISDEIAINKQQFEQNTNTISFANGLFFAALLFTLGGILVFRGLTLPTLESNSSYKTEFRIWRGASYLIFMNWIIGIGLYLLDQFHINYRLILIEFDTFVPKPQAFLQTATILSAIYLVLFLAYLLRAVDIIQGYDLMQHLGYFIWLINIVFLINPFKVLNYQGRMYFLRLIAKVLVSPFRPMNNSIFVVAVIMGSFVQPFSDFSFTMCSLVNDMKIDCIKQAKIATFIYTQVYLIIRVAQSIRSHSQLKVKKTFSKPILGLLAAVFSMNNVVSSFVYNIYLYKGLLIYWIISAIMATIVGVNTDVRANWGLLSFDNEDCILKKTRTFSRKIYFIAMVGDIFLSIGWVFTISNNLSFSDSISPIYFLMILAYIELTRKGIWMFFKLEDDHCVNVNNLSAVVSDQKIYIWLKQRHNLQEKMTSTQNNIAQKNIKQSAVILNINEELAEDMKRENHKKPNVLTIQQIQEQVSRLKSFRQTMQKLVQQFADYLSLMHKMYIRLDCESQI